MFLFTFPARSLDQLDKLNQMIADWGHTTEDWVEYMLSWRDQILEYEERIPLKIRTATEDAIYEHIWHGRTWKIPPKYEQQSEDLALIIGKRGQAILDVFDNMEAWVERENSTEFPPNSEIKRLFRKAKHLCFLLKRKINKEWLRLEKKGKSEELPIKPLGRKPKYNAKDDQAFFDAWQRAKAHKVSFKKFCKDKGSSQKVGKLILGRVRDRKRD